MDGHFDKELWGLCVSPSRNEFFTGGEDKLLIKWDAIKRKIISKKKLEYGIQCLDISRQNQLAVGQKNGIVLLFDAATMNLTRKIADHKNPDRDVVSSLKFSPDGNTLAVGYSPPISKVYLYDIRSEKAKKIG
jgi:WD40 repeat protein